MSKKNSYAARQRQAEKQKKTIIYSIAAVLCVAVLVGVIVGICSCSDGIKYVEADPNLTYYADIDVKGYGKITVQLDQSAAPKTVGNFISLAQGGFYDGLTFHRIIEGFMMQGGDPEGDSTGGAEKTVVGEFSANGYNNPISHKRGVISMARGNEYDSGSSQFFIVHENSESSLDGKYAAFGHVISGMEVVDAICKDARPGYNGAISPEEQPVINSITIRTESKQ